MLLERSVGRQEVWQRDAQHFREPPYGREPHVRTPLFKGGKSRLRYADKARELELRHSSSLTRRTQLPAERDSVRIYSRPARPLSGSGFFGGSRQSRSLKGQYPTRVGFAPDTLKPLRVRPCSANHPFAWNGLVLELSGRASGHPSPWSRLQLPYPLTLGCPPRHPTRERDESARSGNRQAGVPLEPAALVPDARTIAAARHDESPRFCRPIRSSYKSLIGVHCAFIVENPDPACQFIITRPGPPWRFIAPYLCRIVDGRVPQRLGSASRLNRQLQGRRIDYAHR
jgi:hypothetical protein